MLFKNEYDVIIVGAGPGGSMAARVCAEGGLSVLLLEKRQEIGAPKRCGECLLNKELQYLGFSDNENFIMQKLDGSVFVLPNGKQKEIPFINFYNVILERKLFDKALCYKAAEAGAKIIAKATVVDVLKTDGKVTGIKAKIDGKIIDINSKIVIASDGVESKIARMAGLNTTNKTNNMAPGFQYELAGIKVKDEKKQYFFIGNDIVPRGYIWLFPKGKTVANVGIGLVEPKEKTAKEYLDDWIKTQPELKNSSIIEVNSGGIPIGGLLDNMVLDNFMIVGDAAHQVNPLHGGGIGEAAKAGEIAGNVAIKAIKACDTSQKALDEYNKVWWTEHGEKLKKIEKYRKIYTDKLTDRDITIIFESINGEMVSELARGRGAEKLIKIMLKNPKLVMLARHFL